MKHQVEAFTSQSAKNVQQADEKDFLQQQQLNFNKIVDQHISDLID